MIESLRKLEITGKFYIIREIFKKKILQVISYLL